MSRSASSSAPANMTEPSEKKRSDAPRPDHDTNVLASSCAGSAVGHDEISSCYEPMASVERAAESPMDTFVSGLSRFFQGLAPEKFEGAVDVDECVVYAENADEISACFS